MNSAQEFALGRKIQSLQINHSMPAQRVFQDRIHEIEGNVDVVLDEPIKIGGEVVAFYGIGERHIYWRKAGD